MAEKMMTSSNLENRLRYWQSVLRLQDWSISLFFESYGDMDERLGFCETDRHFNDPHLTK